MKVSIACQKGYEPVQKVLEFAKDNLDFTLTDDIYEACKDVDALYTDVLASIGQEG